MDKNRQNMDIESLLLRFNNRENAAFCQVYDIVYNEIFYYAANLYRDTEVVASDVVHDIFNKIWESRKIKFDNLQSLKSYLYIAVKNKFRDYLSHRKCVDKYAHTVKLEDDNFISQVVECETLSIVSEALQILPAECAKVFRLFIDGWEIKEIAAELNKAPSTVYAQKQEAISILKRKLLKDKMLIIMLLLNP